ncbi:hypothetical protein ACFLZX_03020 [Nanoarchaeota archaeon]
MTGPTGDLLLAMIVTPILFAIPIIFGLVLIIKKDFTNKTILALKISLGVFSLLWIIATWSVIIKGFLFYLFTPFCCLLSLIILNKFVHRKYWRYYGALLIISIFFTAYSLFNT